VGGKKEKGEKKEKRKGKKKGAFPDAMRTALRIRRKERGKKKKRKGRKRTSLQLFHRDVNEWKGGGGGKREKKKKGGGENCAPLKTSFRHMNRWCWSPKGGEKRGGKKKKKEKKNGRSVPDCANRANRAIRGGWEKKKRGEKRKIRGNLLVLCLDGDLQMSAQARRKGEKKGKKTRGGKKIAFDAAI